mmetsp:Transcript_86163/g.229030  ORF Transcript_86163/g.229030 Transcript_86163/m.229030 type:complete len:341 (-) Transcript_86163:48-1070(-)
MQPSSGMRSPSRHLSATRLRTVGLTVILWGPRGQELHLVLQHVQAELVEAHARVRVEAVRRVEAADMRLARLRVQLRGHGLEQIREVTPRETALLFLVVHHEGESQLVLRSRLGEHGQTDDEVLELQLAGLVHVKDVECAAHLRALSLLEDEAEGFVGDEAVLVRVHLHKPLVELLDELRLQLLVAHERCYRLRAGVLWQGLRRWWRLRRLRLLRRPGHVGAAAVRGVPGVRPRRRQRGQGGRPRSSGLRGAYLVVPPAEIEVPEQRGGILEGLDELAKVDSTGAVWVRQADHLEDLGIIRELLPAEAERALQLLGPQGAVPVEVDHLEGEVQLLFRELP